MPGKPGFVAELLAVVRKIAGMPNYRDYIAHLRQYHPQSPIPSEREFYDQYVNARYGEGPTRCC